MQLQELQNYFVISLKVDIVTMAESIFEKTVTIIKAKNFTFDAKYSDLHPIILKVTEHLVTKLQIAAGILTAEYCRKL
jgi:hypothetical protein